MIFRRINAGVVALGESPADDNRKASLIPNYTQILATTECYVSEIGDSKAWNHPCITAGSIFWLSILPVIPYYYGIPLIPYRCGE